MLSIIKCIGADIILSILIDTWEDTPIIVDINSVTELSNVTSLSLSIVRILDCSIHTIVIARNSNSIS